MIVSVLGFILGLAVLIGFIVFLVSFILIVVFRKDKYDKWWR